MDRSARAPGRSAANFRVVLIKPSRYDDDGYLVRHVFGAVPCNTLMVLHTLTRSLTAEKRILGAPVPRGQCGFYYQWTSYINQWLWSSGGRFVMEGKTDPATGKTHWYAKEETDYIDPETGGSLKDRPSTWKATLNRSVMASCPWAVRFRLTMAISMPTISMRPAG